LAQLLQIYWINGGLEFAVPKTDKHIKHMSMSVNSITVSVSSVKKSTP